MSFHVYISKPDKNGVYSIGDKFTDLKEYVYRFDTLDHTLLCPACSAHQIKSYEGKCVVCGYDFIHFTAKERTKFIEENKEIIKQKIENYLKGL